LAVWPLWDEIVLGEPCPTASKMRRTMAIFNFAHGAAARIAGRFSNAI
jgi:hypothetical protein